MITLEELLKITGGCDNIIIHQLGTDKPLATSQKEIYDEKFISNYFKKGVKYAFPFIDEDNKPYLQITIK